MTTKAAKVTKPWRRLGETLLYSIGQIRTVKKIYPGIMHLLIFWGVLIQVIGTAIKIMQMGLFVPFTWPLFSERVYFAYELIMDLAGVAILLGVLMALIRRLIFKPDFLENSWDDFYALILLGMIPIVGFITEGLRILIWKPDWAAWAPIGNWIYSLLAKTSISEVQADLIHPYFFFVHLALGLLLTASLPFTKMRHLIFTPIHIFLKSDRSNGKLESIPDIMEAEVLGASAINEFSSLNLLSFITTTQREHG